MHDRERHSLNTGTHAGLYIAMQLSMAVASHISTAAVAVASITAAIHG